MNSIELPIQVERNSNQGPQTHDHLYSMDDSWDFDLAPLRPLYFLDSFPYFLSLPHELQIQIACCLDLPSLFAFSLTCRYVNDLLTTEIFWQLLSKQEVKAYRVFLERNAIKIASLGIIGCFLFLLRFFFCFSLSGRTCNTDPPIGNNTITYALPFWRATVSSFQANQTFCF